MTALIGTFFRAAFAAGDAPDIVRERQFDELKRLLPTIYTGVLVCSFLVAFSFYERAPLLIGFLQAALTVSVTHRIAYWLRADPLTVPIAAKRAVIAAAPGLATVLGAFCSIYGFALDYLAAPGELIIVLMWVAFCGVGVGMSLSPVKSAARLMIVTAAVPFPGYLLVTGAVSEQIVAAIVLAAVPIGARQYWRMGELLENLTRQEFDAERQRGHARDQLRAFMEMASDRKSVV